MTTALANRPSASTPLIGPAERERVLEILRSSRLELEARGIRRLSLFGSVARGEAGPASDIDLLATLDQGTRLSVLDLVAIEGWLAARLGREVEIVTAPDKLSQRAQARVEADRVPVF